MAPPDRMSKRLRLSCTECVKKKRKCDRVMPCSACCFQGAPDGCRYAGNIQGIAQAEEIRRLRKKLASLEAKKAVDETEDVEPLTLTPETQLRLCQKMSAASLTESRISTGLIVQTALVSNFIVNACPANHHQWIWPVAHASEDSLMLWRALTATSYADQALATRDHAMYIEAQSHYTYAVTQLRNHLQRLGQTKTFDAKLLYTMVVLELYETIDFRDRHRWSMHIDGAGAFLHDVDLGLENNIPSAVLDFVRLMDVTNSCIRKQKAYFSHLKWSQATSDDHSRPRSSIGELVDVLNRATALFERSQTDWDTKSTPEVELKEVDDEFARSEFWAELDAVQTDIMSFVGRTDIDEVDSPRGQLSLEVDELSTVIASAFSLIVSRIDTRPWKPTEKSMIDLAALLVKRVVKLSKERTDKTSGVILLFTLRPAYFTFPENHPGRHLTKHILANLSQKFQLQVANNVIEMFPPVVTQSSYTSTPTPSDSSAVY